MNAHWPKDNVKNKKNRWKCKQEYFISSRDWLEKAALL
jgi:hypothetical protein